MSEAQSRLLQASAVAIGGRALLIEGRPGSGKSTLALELIDRGATLIGDDGVSLQLEHGVLVAHPPPRICNKFEIRGVGIFEFETTSAPASLILNLDFPPERLPDDLASRELLGVSLPVLPFDGTSRAAALRAEWALSRYGK